MTEQFHATRQSMWGVRAALQSQAQDLDRECGELEKQLAAKRAKAASLREQAEHMRVGAEALARVDTGMAISLINPHRPKWDTINGDKIVAVTLETARLARTVLRAQNEKDAYENCVNAEAELTTVIEAAR